MKKIFLLFAGIGLFMTSCVSNPEGEKTEAIEAQEVSDAIGAEYALNLQESTVTWTARKVSATHHGTVVFKSGNILVDNSVISGGNFVIDMSSISNQDLEGEWKEKLEGHLLSDDFFSVEEHPEASFQITGIQEGANDSEVNMSGNLTIKGISKNITFKANVAEISANKVQFSADFNIERENWGINYEGMKDDLIAKEINFKIHVVGNN